MSLHETPPPAPHAAGLEVVFVATSPLVAITADAIRAIRGAGGRVVLVSPRVAGLEPARAAADDCIEFPTFGTPIQFTDDEERPARWTVPWVRTVTTNTSRKVVRRFAHKVLGRPVVWGHAIRRSPEALALLERADVITALDPNAVWIAWQAGQKNQHAAIINGIGPTLEHLGLAR